MNNPSGRPAPDAWYDEKAGPIVRLYAMTGGRTGAGEHEFTMSTMIIRTGDRAVQADLSAEQAAVLRLCTADPLSVAEIAAHLALPLGTARVLIADLRRAGLVQPPPRLADGQLSEHMMRRLRDGLMAL